MRQLDTTNNKQGELFDISPFLFPGSIKPLIELDIPFNQEYKLERHMSKFKPLRDFGNLNPLIGLTPESFLGYINKEIAQDHLCRMINEVVFMLDTNDIEGKYSSKGQNSYHPKLLLNVLFYGYATGQRSSRILADKCTKDFHYIFLMQCYTPDHRTISDFRKDNLEEINKYFVDIVRIFDGLGYEQLGNLYIDGMKLKANASSKRTKSKEGYKKWLCSVIESVEDILKEAEEVDRKEDESYRLNAEDPKKQEELKKKLSNRKYLQDKIEEAIEVLKKEDREKLNLTDSDANYMKGGGSKDIRPSYNCQASVTEDGVITAAEAVTIANDQNQLRPMIEQSESNTCKPVKEVSADSNYGNYPNYEYLEEKGIEGYVPDGHFHQYKSGEYKKDKNRYHYSNFVYDESDDSYICPEGKRLNYYKTRKKKSDKREWNHKVYKGVECQSCEKRCLCTKSKYRELLIDMREPLLKAMREKLLSSDGKKKYLKRQYTIEPVFGHLKYNLGYRQFLLRGLEKVKGELRLMCIGWNIKKMLSFGYTAEMVRNLKSL